MLILIFKRTAETALLTVTIYQKNNIGLIFKIRKHN